MNHIFIGTPNYSGSTLMHNLIASDPNVATLRKSNVDTDDFVEGNSLCFGAYKAAMRSQLYTQELANALAIDSNYDWDLIKAKWNEQWSTHPDTTIRLQKTPADIFRTDLMSKHFENLKWIITVKEPYSYIESLFKKYIYLKIDNPHRELDKLCAHAILVLKTQLENKKRLGDTCYATTMEDFLSDKEAHCREIEKFCDVKIDLQKQLWVKGHTSGKYINRNEEKLQMLIMVIPDIIKKINVYFEPHEDLLNAWGYKIRNS
jgi:hypothetical protein